MSLDGISELAAVGDLQLVNPQITNVESSRVFQRVLLLFRRLLTVVVAVPVEFPLLVLLNGYRGSVGHTMEGTYYRSLPWRLRNLPCHDNKHWAYLVGRRYCAKLLAYWMLSCCQ